MIMVIIENYLKYILNNILTKNTIIKYICKNGHHIEKPNKLFKTRDCLMCSSHNPYTIDEKIEMLKNRANILECTILNIDELKKIKITKETSIKMKCKNNHETTKIYQSFMSRGCEKCKHNNQTNTIDKMNIELNDINLKIVSLKDNYDGKITINDKCYIYECLLCQKQYQDVTYRNLKKYINSNGDRKYCC